MKRSPVLVLAACLACLHGCSAKEAVSVSGSIGDVKLSVTEGSLVTTLAGSFNVSLELGARASDGTDVTFSAFSLVRADTGAALSTQDRLSVVSVVQPPYHLDPGGSVVIEFEVGDQPASGGATEPMQVDKDAYGEICGAGGIRIVGTLQDSAQGQRSLPLTSGVVTPSGC